MPTTCATLPGKFTQSVAGPAHAKTVTTAGATSRGRLAIDNNNNAAAPVAFRAMTSQSMAARPEAYSA